MNRKSITTLDLDEIVQISRELAWLLAECEKISVFDKINKNARRFFLVGERELMFESLYKFVEGNERFKLYLAERYSKIVNFFSEYTDFDQLTPNKWEIQRSETGH